MSVVLGLNAFHPDSSACILRDGHLLAAVEEERFNRIKHWAGLPVQATRYCLQEAGVSLNEVSAIAINSDPHANLCRRALFTLLNRPRIDLIRDRLLSRRKRGEVVSLLASKLDMGDFSGEVHLVEHHLAHVASAFLISPFNDAALLSVDGFGDFTSTASGFGNDCSISIGERTYFPHSLGIFYETVTHFLGFKRYGDEYKVMGLAPYGRPEFVAEMERIVRISDDGEFRLDLRYFRHHTGVPTFKWESCEPAAEDYFSEEFVELLGTPREPSEPLTQRHKDLAHSAQILYERALFQLLRRNYEQYGCNAVVLSGGCAFNSVANGKIRSNTPFEKVFVQPAAGDAGGALGAALYVCHVLGNNARSFRMQNAYFGPQYSDECILSEMSRRAEDLSRHGFPPSLLDVDELCRTVAAALADGKVVGWFQGRMEWGPRALGNRSILADPRRSEMKQILNSKIKHRESFRPFAPSVLRERVKDWFEDDDDVPFMMKVLTVREDRRHVIPAVTHVDGSARLQTVSREQNPKFYRLIEEFEALTGVPMVLNTSFNENEPIVNSVEDALDCFLRTEMDMIVIGNRILTRSGRGEGRKLESAGHGHDTLAYDRV